MPLKEPSIYISSPHHFEYFLTPHNISSLTIFSSLTISSLTSNIKVFDNRKHFKVYLITVNTSKQVHYQVVNKVCLKFKYFICLGFDLISLQVYLVMFYEFVIVDYSFQCLHPHTHYCIKCRDLRPKYSIQVLDN